MYDVKLGHKGQCDAAARATGGSLHGPTNSSSTHSGFQVNLQSFVLYVVMLAIATTVLPAKCDSDIMFRLQIYQGLRIDRSLVY